MNCYICDTEITPQNESEEHIIINAAGGKLKSKVLLCKKCNSEIGHEIDSELAKQLNIVANTLMIKRDSGKPQAIIGDKISSGEKYSIETGGKPSYTKPTVLKSTERNQTKYSITARSEAELRDILKGIAKKNPQFNVAEAMKHAQSEKEYLDEALQFEIQVGGKEVFRAVCKCATNYFIHNGGETSQIKHLIPYIKGITDENVVRLHYQENMYSLASHESFHILHLVGNSKNNILYCYVDYFNTYRYLVLLNSNYKGVDIVETYCYDLINYEQVNKSIDLEYDRDTLLDFFTNNNPHPFEKVKKSFEHTMALGLKRQEDYHRGEILERAIQNSLSKYPEGVPITEKIINETIDEIMKEIEPYLTKRTK